jgi:hypothetical protein
VTEGSGNPGALIFSDYSFALRYFAMMNLVISLLGFLLILLLLTEEFREALKKLWQRLTSQPRGKYLAYPLALVLVLAAAGLIVFSLWTFMSITFSYD